MRSKFVHNLGMESLKPKETIEVLKYTEAKGQYLEEETILNIHAMVNIVWAGIMKKFGFIYP